MNVNDLADETTNLVLNNCLSSDGTLDPARMRGIIRDKLQAVYAQTCRNLGAVPQAPLPTTPAITEAPWRVPGDAPTHTPWDDFRHTLTLVRGISESDRQILKEAAEHLTFPSKKEHDATSS